MPMRNIAGGKRINMKTKLNRDYILTFDQWMEHRKARTGRVVKHIADDDGRVWAVVAIWQEQHQCEVVYFVPDEPDR